MGKWQRSLYQPVLPLGKDGKRVTGSAEHIALSRKAAGEGMVLVKNENDTLPLAKGTKVALFGKGTIDYVKGGGGSGDVTVEYIRNFYEGMKIKEAKGEVSLFHELPDEILPYMSIKEIQQRKSLLPNKQVPYVSTEKSFFVFHIFHKQYCSPHIR